MHGALKFTMRAMFLPLLFGRMIRTLGLAAAFLAIAAQPCLADHNEDPEQVVLQLRWYHQFQFAGYYAALAKGYYAEAGLDVTIREGGAGINHFDAVESGQADFGVCGAEILLEHAKGREFTIVAPIFQHSPAALLTLRSSHITGPHDLAGKRIMLSPGSEPDIWAMLLREGVDAEDFTLADPTWDIQELMDGRVDAMAAYITNTPYALRRDFIPYTLIQPVTYGVDFYGDCLFASRHMVSDHPDVVARFRDASLRGWEYAMDHPDEIIDLILDQYSPGKDRDQLKFEAEAMRSLILPELVQMGHINYGRWERMAEVYVELGMMAPGSNFSGFFYEPGWDPDQERLKLVMRVTLFIAMGVALAAVVLFIFNRRLRREIEKRNKAQAELRQSEERFRALFQGLPIPTVIWQVSGDDLMLTDFNRSAEEQSKGVLRSYRHTMARNEQTHPPAIADDLHKALNEKTTFNTILTYPFRSTGVTHSMDLTYGFIEPDTVIMHAIDVTEREQAQEAMRAAKEQAEAASRMKSEFLSSISHEVRTPMNAIIGLADLLANSGLEDEQQEWLESLQHAAHSLMDLISNILNFSNLENGSLELIHEPFTTASVAQSVIQPLKELAAAKGLALSWNMAEDVPELLVGDGPRLKHVLVNLMDNAVKFTAQGSVTLEITRESDAHQNPTILRFTITDTGIGIEPSDQERIFDSFTQADGTLSRQYGGTGLGLTIAQRIVELMGGRLKVESRPGQGSAFSFAIPFQVDPEFV